MCSSFVILHIRVQPQVVIKIVVVGGCLQLFMLGALLLALSCIYTESAGKKVAQFQLKLQGKLEGGFWQRRSLC